MGIGGLVEDSAVRFLRAGCAGTMQDAVTQEARMVSAIGLRTGGGKGLDAQLTMICRRRAATRVGKMVRRREC